jgi:hypothetical protein
MNKQHHQQHDQYGSRTSVNVGHDHLRTLCREHLSASSPNALACRMRTNNEDVNQAKVNTPLPVIMATWLNRSPLGYKLEDFET